MLNLFFPDTCRGCHREILSSENHVCANCRHNLPLAGFHKNGSEEMRQIFYGRVTVENVTALFYFKKDNLTQKFIHALKYKRAKKIGEVFGEWLGNELVSCKEYQSIDVVIPVPVHKKN